MLAPALLVPPKTRLTTKNAIAAMVAVGGSELAVSRLADRAGGWRFARDDRLAKTAPWLRRDEQAALRLSNCQ